MTELARILAAYDAARGRGADAILATVVHVQGSTYRRPGARRLLTSDGQSVGTISGGCLEKEIQRRGWWLAREHGAVVVRFDTGSGEDAVAEFGLGCGGIVDVLLERLDAAATPAYLDALRGFVVRREVCVLATVIANAGSAGAAVGARFIFHDACEIADFDAAWVTRQMREDARATLHEGRSRAKVYSVDAGGMRMFFEAVSPPPHLVIVGAGADAAPLARLAKEVGWNVTVADGRLSAGGKGRFPSADHVVTTCPGELGRHVSLDARVVAVVMTHNLADDGAALRELATTNVRYIGILGPRSRTATLLAELGGNAAADRRIFAPVGLDIGAETPEEIALAIVAEIRAHLAGHPAGFLRDREGPIHRPPLADAGVDSTEQDRAEAQSSPREAPPEQFNPAFPQSCEVER